ncbi:MAG: lysylphosphatidylglycerol synthase transmembrane domain-containing protein [Gaiellaceae bacterium]
MTAVPAAPAPKKGVHVHIKRILIGALVIVVVAALANLLGWDIWGWLKSVWDTMTSITVESLIAAIVLKTLQTGLTAFGWYWILRYGFPNARIRWLDIFALYAASVALNSFLPANLGTLMYLIMLTATIAGATFAGILGGYVVQKIFYTLIGGFTYLYLFLTVGGSFDIKFNFVHTHPWATAVLLIGIAILIYLLVRRFWPRVVAWWDEAKEGGAILGHPRAYFVRVFLPSLGSWFAMLGVMCVFLHAYDIPISFHTLMRICGGNSIANVTSVTPGGAGVNQAFNVASLKGVTTSANATAYSVAQQLVTTFWNIALAIILMAWAFGWSGGKSLVESSYGEAKQKAADQSEARKAKKEAKKAAKAAES